MGAALVSKLSLLMQARYLGLPLSTLAAVACLALAACSTSESLLPMQPYVPPSMPTTADLVAGVKQAAAEAHLTAPLEMSDLRSNDHWPGHFHGVYYAAYRTIAAPASTSRSSMRNTRHRDCL
jgi:hypothetical protein